MTNEQMVEAHKIFDEMMDKVTISREEYDYLLMDRRLLDVMLETSLNNSPSVTASATNGE